MGLNQEYMTIGQSKDKSLTRIITDVISLIDVACSFISSYTGHSEKICYDELFSTSEELYRVDYARALVLQTYISETLKRGPVTY